MDTPRYVATKIGDRYEMIRHDPRAKIMHGAATAAGTGLVVFGLARRGVFGWLGAAAGCGLIYHGLTGRHPIDMIRRALHCEGQRDAAQAPSYPNDEQAPSPQLPQDRVEEASMGSFPASDAPAHLISTSDSD